MNAYKFNAMNDNEALEAIRHFKNLDYKQTFELSKIGYVPYHIFAKDGLITWLHNDAILYEKHEGKEISLKDLSEIAYDHAYSSKYKIKINGDRKLADEVKRIAADIGLYHDARDGHANFYGWGIGRKSCSYVNTVEEFEKGYLGELITIQDLRDMAVLHRNNPADATHSISVASDRPDQPVFKTSKGVFHTYSENNSKWVECGSINDKTTGLKSIKKKKEYLIPQNAGGFMHKIAYDQGFIPKDWIEIPEGATFATGIEDLTFRKEFYLWDDGNPINSEPYWRNTDITLERAKKMRMLTVAWVREDSSINDIIKTAEDHRQSRIDAPELTDFGIVAKPDFIDRLNSLCAEFNCPVGAPRIDWLKQQLVLAAAEQNNVNKQVKISRDEARERIATMMRGEAIKINSLRIEFSDNGNFTLWNGTSSPLQTKSMNTVLNYIFGQNDL